MAPASREPPPYKVARFATPFIGREPELGMLDGTFESVAKGRPRIVLLAGDAGVGKTRLLREIEVVLEGKATVLWGHCLEDSGIAYLPFIEALNSLREQRPDILALLEAGDAHTVSSFLGLSPASATMPSEQDQLRLSLAVSKLFVRLSQSRPIVLIVDDLHWADTPTLDLLTHVTFAVADSATRRGTAILVVATYRPTELADRVARGIARLQREEVSDTVDLSGLDDAEIAQLIQGLGFPRPSNQLVSTVARATDGNPLFIQEAIEHLAKRGAIEEREGHLVTTVPALELKLPSQVTDAIASRIRALGDDKPRLLALAAVLGDAFDYSTLRALSSETEDALLEALDECVRQRFLVSEGSGLRFAHPLIRYVAYNETSGPRRQRLHLQVAEALQERLARSFASDPRPDRKEESVAEVAHHLLSAGALADGEEVVDFCTRAADQAFAIFAWGQAARFYEAALAAAERTAAFSPGEKARLHHRAGLAYYRDLDTGPCLHQFRQAIEGFQALGDISSVAAVLIDDTRCRITQAAAAYGSTMDVQPLEEALEALGDGEPELRGQLLGIMSQVYWTARQTEKAEEAAQRALEIGERLKDDRLCTSARNSLALAALQSLRMKDALDNWNRGTVHASRVGDPWVQGWSPARVPLAMTWLGDLNQAEIAANEALEMAERTHNWADQSLTLSSLITIATARGDFQAAEEYAHQGMRAIDRSNYPWGGALFLPALASARALRGEWQEAEDALDLLVEPGRLFDDVGPAIRAIDWLYRQLIRAQVASDAGEPSALESSLERVLGRARVDVAALPGYCALVEIASLSQTPALVRNAQHPLRTAAERGVVLSGGWVFLIERILGVAATLGRDWEEAESHLGSAIKLAERIGARTELAQAQLNHASMLVQRGQIADRQRAGELLANAATLFHELKMKPFLPRVTDLARLLETRLPATKQVPRPAYPDGLSEREVEVILLIAKGRSNQQIADELILSAKTVARHISNIFDKIGVDKRAAAAAYAFEKGLVERALRAVL